MKLTRTAKIKLNISASEILPTLAAYTNAFNFVCQVGFSGKEKNGINLHKLTYQQVRKDFNLPSQLAISSRMKATEALKSVFTKTKYKKYGSCPKSKSCSIRLDKNSYSLFFNKQEVKYLDYFGKKKISINYFELSSKIFQNLEKYFC